MCIKFITVFREITKKTEKLKYTYLYSPTLLLWVVWYIYFTSRTAAINSNKCVNACVRVPMSVYMPKLEGEASSPRKYNMCVMSAPLTDKLMYLILIFILRLSHDFHHLFF